MYIINYQNGVHNNENNIKFKETMEQTLEILQKTLNNYKSEELFLSFNGGKDCTVLLDLFLNIFRSRSECNGKTLNCIYIEPTEPFSELQSFIVECENRYNLKILKIKGNLKDILTDVCQSNPMIKACLMGGRKTDPYCNTLNVFQETDPGWPKLMRINPLLEWKYEDIWYYLRTYNVPYCNLYDIGYTSIDDRTNTIPNPRLKYKNSITGEDEYKPAYELDDGAFERLGRLQKINKQTAATPVTSYL